MSVVKVALCVAEQTRSGAGDRRNQRRATAMPRRVEHARDTQEGDTERQPTAAVRLSELRSCAGSARLGPG